MPTSAPTFDTPFPTHHEGRSCTLNAEILIHHPEHVPEAALEAITATASQLGVAVLHTLIGPPSIDTALAAALRRSELTIVVGADHRLTERLCAQLGLHLRPSRRAASYIAAACKATGRPLDSETQSLALMPAGSTVMGCPTSLDLGCGLTLGGRGLVFLPADPAPEILTGDFSAFIGGLLMSRDTQPAPAPTAPVEPTATGPGVGKADVTELRPAAASTEAAPGPLGDPTTTTPGADLAPPRRRRLPLLLILCVLACVGAAAYPHLVGNRATDPADAYIPDPVPLKEHHYRYLQQDVYEALYPDSGADQLNFLDLIMGGDSDPDEATAPPAPETDPTPPPAAPSEPPPAVSSEPPPVQEPVSSEPPPVSSTPPPEPSSEPPVVSSEPAPVYEDPTPASNPEDDPDDEGPDDLDDPHALPAASGWDETLHVTVNGSRISRDAYELVCQIVQIEMGGSLDTEALKAQAVAAYTYVKYNNSRGLYPSVGLNTNVNAKVRSAVSEVSGRAIYYDGAYINAVYHSTSRGSTTSARAVWGGNIPYLTPVDSEWDSASPYYSTRYTISADSFRSKVYSTYGIDLSGDPSDWIEIDTSALADGGYVGRVYIGGTDTSQGGRVAAGTAITGRSVREVLLGFGLRSHSFDVYYDGSQFVFNCYGYGHGVGLSQYGAHFMARQGYNYVEILEHYYTGAVVR